MYVCVCVCVQAFINCDVFQSWIINADYIEELLTTIVSSD